MIKSLHILSLVWVLLLSPVSLSAGEKYRVVLQISDDSAEKQALVLNVADNLYAEFGHVLQLEIVAFGPGLGLMLSDTKQAARLKTLNQNGIKLVACRNTAVKLARLTGQKIELNPNVDYTEGGASHIVRLTRKGYVLLRP